MRPWTTFATLTFDCEGRPGYGVPAPSTAQGTRSRVLQWCASSERALGQSIIAIGAVDYHRLGEPHAHVLVDIGSSEAGDRERVHRILRDTWFVRNGRAQIEVPRRTSRVIGYVAAKLVGDEDPAGLITWPDAGPLSTRP